MQVSSIKRIGPARGPADWKVTIFTGPVAVPCSTAAPVSASQFLSAVGGYAQPRTCVVEVSGAAAKFPEQKCARFLSRNRGGKSGENGEIFRYGIQCQILYVLYKSYTLQHIVKHHSVQLLNIAWIVYIFFDCHNLLYASMQHHKNLCQFVYCSIYCNYCAHCVYSWHCCYLHNFF